MSVDWKKAQEKAARTGRWTVTMAKVRIQRVVSRTRWQLATFYGKSGGESVGIADLLDGVISVLAFAGVLRPVFAE